MLEPKGSSFIGHHGDDFLPAIDLVWAGFSVEIGSEGGVYVLDWHDQNICNRSKISQQWAYLSSDADWRKDKSQIFAMSMKSPIYQLHSNDWFVRYKNTPAVSVGKRNAQSKSYIRNCTTYSTQHQSHPKDCARGRYVTGGLRKTVLRIVNDTESMFGHGPFSFFVMRVKQTHSSQSGMQTGFSSQMSLKNWLPWHRMTHRRL